MTTPANTYEVIRYTILQFFLLVIDNCMYSFFGANQLEETKEWWEDTTDKTGVIILSLDNRQSCHVIPMQLHCMTQQLLEESSSTGMSVLWHKCRLLHMEEKCLWILIMNDGKSSRMTEQMNKQARWMKERFDCSFINSSSYSFIFRCQNWTLASYKLEYFR